MLHAAIQGGPHAAIQGGPHAAAGLAVLLAGQIRTFEEADVRRSLLHNVIDPTSASVFAHLAAEHSYAPWHHLTSETFSVPNRSNDTWRLLLRRIEREMHPRLRLLRIMSDDELLATSPIWVGPLLGDSALQSALMLRWYLLLDAMSAEEAIRSQPFNLVLRLRPDAVLPCSLPMSWTTSTSSAESALAPHQVLVSRDYAMLALRQAATVGLAAYLVANRTAACRIKVELCLGGVLLARNFSVGVMPQPGAVIVRPQAICAASAVLAEPSYDGHLQPQRPHLGCGREVLPQRLVHGQTPNRSKTKSCSATSARPWNLTTRLRYWGREL